MDVPSVRLIVPGGILRRESNSLSGPMAEAALANLQADRLYLGADGLDPEIGVMTPHLAEAELNAKMIRISRAGGGGRGLLQAPAPQHLAHRQGRADPHADHRPGRARGGGRGSCGSAASRCGWCDAAA